MVASGCYTYSKGLSTRWPSMASGRGSDRLTRLHRGYPSRETRPTRMRIRSATRISLRTGCGTAPSEAIARRTISSPQGVLHPRSRSLRLSRAIKPGSFSDGLPSIAVSVCCGFATSRDSPVPQMVGRVPLPRLDEPGTASPQHLSDTATVAPRRHGPASRPLTVATRSSFRTTTTISTRTMHAPRLASWGPAPWLGLSSRASRRRATHSRYCGRVSDFASPLKPRSLSTRASPVRPMTTRSSPSSTPTNLDTRWGWAILAVMTSTRRVTPMPPLAMQ